MIQRLNILIVEDSQSDTELLLHEMGRNGYELLHQRVDSAATMTAALESHPWDAVVADYVIPGFGGMQALELFRAKGFDIPFIVVSGSAGEELAVDMMKAGADDYILK